jgi:arsenate reductase (thioredoxin)
MSFTSDTSVVIGLMVFGMCLGTAVATTSALPQAQGSQVKSARPPTVLFMCPHGAAKSVLASAYFQRVAKERGLNVHVISAGTDPDPHVAPAVASHLTKNGYDVPITKPRRVTPEEVATADVIVSIGCELRGLPTPNGTLVEWDDVPAPSEDFARADEKIRERVIQLVDELVRKQPR